MPNPKNEETSAKEDNCGFFSTLKGCVTAAIKILAYEYQCCGVETEEKEDDKKINPRP